MDDGVVDISSFKKKKLEKAKIKAEKQLADEGVCIVPHDDPPRYCVSLNQKSIHIMELIGLDIHDFMKRHKQTIATFMQNLEYTFFSTQYTPTGDPIDYHLQVNNKQTLEEVRPAGTRKIRFIADGIMAKGRDTWGDGHEFLFARCDIKVSLSGFEQCHPLKVFNEKELLEL